VEKKEEESALIVRAKICQLSQLDIDLRGGLALYSNYFPVLDFSRSGLKGNPVKIRNCPAAVSRNERST
jgi:hypothetical protein